MASRLPKRNLDKLRQELKESELHSPAYWRQRDPLTLPNFEEQFQELRDQVFGEPLDDLKNTRRPALFHEIKWLRVTKRHLDQAIDTQKRCQQELQQHLESLIQEVEVLYTVIETQNQAIKNISDSLFAQITAWKDNLNRGKYNSCPNLTSF